MNKLQMRPIVLFEFKMGGNVSETAFKLSNVFILGIM